MIRLWATIANKLGISQEEALLLHALLRGWLNPLARRRAVIVIGNIVEKFDLDETDFEASYARQLLAKGILTATEVEVFMGNYRDEGEVSVPEERSSSGTSGEPSGTGVDAAGGGRSIKRTRGPSSGTREPEIVE